MARFLTILTLMLASASPAAAQSADAYYRATFATKVAPGRVVSSDVVWTAHDTMLEAGAAGDIPKRVCAVLAQKVGPITAFTADGKPLSDEDLGYCNKHARKAK